MNQSLQTSNSESDEAEGMSDEAELRRWMEYHANSGIGEGVLTDESYRNELLGLGLLPNDSEL